MSVWPRVDCVRSALRTCHQTSWPSSKPGKLREQLFADANSSSDGSQRIRLRLVWSPTTQTLENDMNFKIMKLDARTQQNYGIQMEKAKSGSMMKILFAITIFGMTTSSIAETLSFPSFRIEVDDGWVHSIECLLFPLAIVQITRKLRKRRAENGQ